MAERRCQCPGCYRNGNNGRGCWYKTTAWRRTAAAVHVRDRHVCWVNACGQFANVADHIEPVHPQMTWHEFLAMSNLRDSCKRHNTARGVAARLQREVEEGVAPLPSRNPFARRSRFSNRATKQDVGSSRVDLQACKLEYSIVSPK